MTDPFRIQGPALISFSGGRSSGYMVWRILQAHGGELPGDVIVAFANTGKERPETLEFVRDCGERWAIDIVWVEWKPAERDRDRWRRVTFETAARDGQPFAALIDWKGFLPSPVNRMCTDFLKVRSLDNYMRSLGFNDGDRVLGLRADERGRVAKIRARQERGKDAFGFRMPLVSAGITKRDVITFWKRQNFDLRLASIRGVTPAGNCDLCFLKGVATIKNLIRLNPELVEWWAAQEAKPLTKANASAQRFRIDRPGYADLAAGVRDQYDMGFDDVGDDEIVDCMCGDGS